MEKLLELRGQLDEIDAQIVDLYQKRMDICSKVGDYKIAPFCISERASDSVIHYCMLKPL